LKCRKETSNLDTLCIERCQLEQPEEARERTHAAACRLALDGAVLVVVILTIVSIVAEEPSGG
jgi:hypothetical protein